MVYKHPLLIGDSNRSQHMKKMRQSLPRKRLKPAEEVMSNEDLLLEVLLRLPAKSLIRFKSVSKHWLSLITDPQFCSKHTRLNPKLQALGIYFKLDNVFTYDLKTISFNQANLRSLPTLTLPQNAHRNYMYAVMHSCNGLFLYCAKYRSPILVCNAATGAITRLPKENFAPDRYYQAKNFASLVFEPLKSPYFKVVLLDMYYARPDIVFHNDHEKSVEGSAYTNCYRVDVFSSETGVWKRMYFRALHGSHLDHKAVCNGKLHWITTKKFHARFDVDSENVISKPLPSKPKTLETEKIRYFGECCGRLFLIHIPWRSASVFNVLELDKDDSVWNTKYSVNFNLVRRSFPSSFQWPDPSTQRLSAGSWNLSVLCVVKEDENDNDLSLLLAIPGKIVSYNLKSKLNKVLLEMPMEYFSLGPTYPYADYFLFMPTLSPIRLFLEVEEIPTLF